MTTMQDTYDTTGGVPHITLASGEPLTIRDNSTPIGDVFILEDNSGSDFFAVSATDMDVGPAGRRLLRPRWPDSTGRMGIEAFPDDFSITTATGTNNSLFYTDTNVATDRSYDADSTTVDELADVLGTLITDLQALGLIG